MLFQKPNTSKRHTLVGGHVRIIYEEGNNHKLRYFKVVFPGLHSVRAIVTTPVPCRTEIDGYVKKQQYKKVVKRTLMGNRGHGKNNSLI